MSMTLWQVRHAQPLIAAGICYGATDVPADVQATQAAAESLALCLPRGLSLRTSPLNRCTLLAHHLLKLRPDLSCTVDARLAEMNFGCWEGQPWDAIPRAEFDAWTADFGAYSFGGSESVAAFMARVSVVWDETVMQGEDTIWITHAGVIRATTLLAQGTRQVSQADQWPQKTPAFGQWCQVTL